MTTQSKKEVIEGLLTLLNHKMRETDFRAIELMSEGGNGSEDHLIDIAAEYAWDHLLGEPQSPSIKEIAATYKKARTWFSKTVRLLGQFNWRELKEKRSLDQENVLRVFTHSGLPDLVIGVKADGQWVAKGKTKVSGSPKELDKYLRGIHSMDKNPHIIEAIKSTLAQKTHDMLEAHKQRLANVLLHEDHKFCPNCSGALAAQDRNLAMKCPGCGWTMNVIPEPPKFIEPNSDPSKSGPGAGQLQSKNLKDRYFKS